MQRTQIRQTRLTDDYELQRSCQTVANYANRRDTVFTVDSEDFNHVQNFEPPPPNSQYIEPPPSYWSVVQEGPTKSSQNVEPNRL